MYYGVNKRTIINLYYRPSCWDVEMIVKMLDSGMDVARLNFSHGDHKVNLPYLNSFIDPWSNC